MGNPVAGIIAKFQTQQGLADAIGVRQSTVAAWKKAGLIPSRQIARILDEARKRDIELRPDDFFADAMACSAGATEKVAAP